MKLFKSLFGSKKKIFPKREPNTLAEINESPDLRLTTAKEREEINISTNNQVKKNKKASSKVPTTTKQIPADNIISDSDKVKAEKNEKNAKSPVKKNTNHGKSNTVSAITETKKSSSLKSGEKEQSETKAKTVEKKAQVKSDVRSSTNKAQAKPDDKIDSKKSTASVEENKLDEITETRSTRTGKFEIKKSKDGRFVFNLYASNNVIVATSQIYSSSASAMNGIKSVIANAATANIEDQTLKAVSSVPYPKWEIYRDKSEQYRFRLSASNGSCVCHSQGYTSKTNCKKGIESIIKFAADAEITKAYIKKDN